MHHLIDELRDRQTLPDEGLRRVLLCDDPAAVQYLHDSAREVAVASFGRTVKLRALIEWSNRCRNDCRYCGIRCSNLKIRRYTLSREEILASCEAAWRKGLRTFVLQGGENPAGAEALADTVGELRAAWPEAAITLSLGELPEPLYALLRKRGANRYLLRHETASPAHYALLHPATMRLENRMACLRTLRQLGYETGTGMLIGAPFQTVDHLVADIRFLEAFRPDMIGTGPFIPHPDTPFATQPAGSPELTLRIYSILRLMHPKANIPSTTALSTLLPDGRTAGILAGANVLMPNFTPAQERGAYDLYAGKTSSSLEGESNLQRIQQELNKIQYDYV